VLGDDPLPATILLFEDRADLALLKVRGLSRDSLVATVPDSATIRAGQQVFVVGAPYFGAVSSDSWMVA
jgi:S1-C subfamily serine protease